MRFYEAIDRFVADKRRYRGFAVSSEVAYRRTLGLLAEQVGNAHPSTVGRADCMEVLKRWSGNALRTNRAHLVSFFKWAMEEGLADSNPAAATPAVRAKAQPRYRLNYAEIEAMLEVVETVVEWRAIGLGLLGGFRSRELRGLRGRHFRRDRLIEVTPDIGKGGKSRWVAVPPGLVAVVAEIRQNVEADHFVLPAQRWRDVGRNTQRMDLRTRPLSQQALGSLVEAVAKRAKVAGHVTARCLRHANAQVMAEYAGVYMASAQLGHADLRTTRGYLATATTDQLMDAVRGLALRTSVLKGLPVPREATTGIEPV